MLSQKEDFCFPVNLLYLLVQSSYSNLYIYGRLRCIIALWIQSCDRSVLGKDLFIPIRACRKESDFTRDSAAFRGLSVVLWKVLLLEMWTSIMFLSRSFESKDFVRCMVVRVVLSGDEESRSQLVIASVIIHSPFPAVGSTQI